MQLSYLALDWLMSTADDEDNRRAGQRSLANDQALVTITVLWS